MDKHFEGLTSTVAGGIVTKSHVARPVLGSDTCCWVVPTNVPRGDAPSESDALVISEVGALLYKKLEVAPSFWLALAGVGVDDVRTDGGVDTMLRDEVALPAGLVIALKNWRDAGEPPNFVRFRPGYMWRPWPASAR